MIVSAISPRVDHLNGILLKQHQDGHVSFAKNGEELLLGEQIVLLSGEANLYSLTLGDVALREAQPFKLDGISPLLKDLAFGSDVEGLISKAIENGIDPITLLAILEQPVNEPLGSGGEAFFISPLYGMGSVTAGYDTQRLSLATNEELPLSIFFRTLSYNYPEYNYPEDRLVSLPPSTSALPTVALSGIPAPLTVDETNLGLVANLNIANNFISTSGMDEPGFLNYDLSINNGPTGLVDSASNEGVLVSMNNGVVEGRTAISNALVFTVTVDNDGTITFMQQRAVMHTPNTGPDESTTLIANNLITLTATITNNNGDSAAALVDLGQSFLFKDDAPIAGPAQIKENVVVSQDTNLMIILDVSGSMGDSAGVGFLSRLELAQQSILNIFDQYESLGNVKVQLILFSNNAQASGWIDVDEARSLLNNANNQGQTNYDSALNAAWNAFEGAGKLATGAQNVSYFLSDGMPTVSNVSTVPNNGFGAAVGISPSEESQWINFLTTNSILSYALGIGEEVNESNLNPIAYNGITSTNLDGMVVTDLNNLPTTLISLTNTIISGNIITESTVSLGTEEGHLSSVEINGVLYNYNSAAPIINVLTSIGGSISLHMGTGAYTYVAPVLQGHSQELPIIYTLTDKDGDSSSSTLIFVINQNSLTLQNDLVITNQGISGGLNAIDIPDWALLYNDIGLYGTQLIESVNGATDGSVSHANGITTFSEENSGALDGGTFNYEIAGQPVNVTIERVNTNLIGTAESDILLAGSSSNLQGNDGNDVLIGSSGDDQLLGGEGNDLLVGRGGNNEVTGGDGIDTAAYFNTTSSVVASLLTNLSTSNEGTDTLSSIENLVGSQFDDTLIGDSNANFISGSGGNDSINGGEGKDLIHGGAGNDVLTGGSGSNTYLWLAGDIVPMPSTDMISDFNKAPVAAGGDVLNLKELLTGESSIQGSLDNYLNFTQTGANTTLVIDSTGSGNFASPTQTIVFQNVDLMHNGGTPLSNIQVIDSLVQNGNLVVDA